jgi:hypothetical protein
MLPLLVLTLLFLSAWIFGVWERPRYAAFMAEWVHVLLAAAVILLIMTIISAVR